MSDSKKPRGSDLCFGLEAIGEHMNIGVRQVQYLHGQHAIPTFKMGRTVCALKSQLAEHFRKLSEEANGNRN